MTPAELSLWAVLSDIHGNRWALEAVLRDVESRGIRNIVNLGDCLYGPLDPAGTADILLPLACPTAAGNEDRIIVEDGADCPTLRFVRSRLSRRHLGWLESLPPLVEAAQAFCMFHGSPGRDDEYLLRAVTPSGVVDRRPDELERRLAGIEASVVLCGHDHLPAAVRLGDGRLVVDPGSVGLQAYTDDAPYPHAMETGTPEARYAVVSRTAGGWQAEQIAVPYDWWAAAAAAERNGREDWAGWLRTGRAAGA